MSMHVESLVLIARSCLSFNYNLVDQLELEVLARSDRSTASRIFFQ